MVYWQFVAADDFCWPDFVLLLLLFTHQATTTPHAYAQQQTAATRAVRPEHIFLARLCLCLLSHTFFLFLTLDFDSISIQPSVYILLREFKNYN